MKTFPDFTWEWIIESCQRLCDQIQDKLDNEPDHLPERLKEYIEITQGIIAIVPKLREHPQLKELVPMKSLMSLRWFPSDNYEVDLNCVENGVKYRVVVLKVYTDTRNIEAVVDEKVVAFDDSANEFGRISPGTSRSEATSGKNFEL